MISRVLRRVSIAMQRRKDASNAKKLTLVYLANNRTKKLHIGCGGNILPEWLNTDYFPTNPNIAYLDATKQFPFQDGTFDYVFSEHMIEHITYADGLIMLKQCNRILKSGGKIRLSTPNLRFLVDLYSENKSELQERYIQWASDLFIKNGVYSDTMVINNFVRDWGHVFIYDEKTLRLALEVSGFVDVHSYRINESDDPALKNLENEERMPAGFLQLESFTLEARKP
jgi:predicted SAM-dependent methyltransferase